MTQWEILELKLVVPTLPLLVVAVVLPTVFVFVASSPMNKMILY